MGSDDLFKKRREARTQRKHGYKSPKANSYLIVTEGERTEPLYFKGMQKLIQEKVGGVVDIIEQPLIDVYGEGCSTTRLVEVADQIIKDAKIIYQNVWIVFDKDDFDDFDQAIQEAINRGYNVAWSNQSFEYWLYLHFYYSGTALHRHQWNVKLDEIFKKNNLGNGTYQKNYDDIYSLAGIYGGVNAAIKHSKRRMAEFEKGGYKPSEYDPGTMVYKLVESLKVYLE